MKILKILLFIGLIPLSFYLFDFLFMYSITMSHRLNLWGKIFFFFPVLGLSYYIPAYVIGGISLLNPYRWLSYLVILPTIFVWVGFNAFDLWTMPLEYTFNIIFESSYFTLVLLIFLASGIYAPIGFEELQHG